MVGAPKGEDEGAEEVLTAVTLRTYEVVSEPIAFDLFVTRGDDVAGDGDTSCNGAFDTDRCIPRPQYWFQSPTTLKGLFQPTATFRIGAGLSNFANVCFLNATVQALCYCPPFARGCLSKVHAKHCSRRKASQLCGFCEFEKFVGSVLSGCRSRPTQDGEEGGTRREGLGCEGVALWPSLLLRIMRKQIRLNSGTRFFSGDASGGGAGNWFGLQNCAHEWLTQFLDFLTRQDLPTELASAFDEGRIRHAELRTCYINQLFSAEYEDTKTCQDCKNETKYFELSTCLRLNISDSLHKSLRTAFKPELLTGSNKPRCDACGIPQEKIAKRLISRPPNILTLLIQRTEFGATQFASFFGSGSSRHVYKNAKSMDIPLTLDLTDFTSKECQQLFSSSSSEASTYHLASAVCHAGSVGFGHYWAVVAGEDGNYYEIDDETVRQISQSEMRKQLGSAYLLFYARKEPVNLLALAQKAITPSPNACQHVTMYGSPADDLASQQKKEAAFGLKLALTYFPLQNLADDKHADGIQHFGFPDEEEQRIAPDAKSTTSGGSSLGLRSNEEDTEDAASSCSLSDGGSHHIASESDEGSADELQRDKLRCRDRLRLLTAPDTPPDPAPRKYVDSGDERMLLLSHLMRSPFSPFERKKALFLSRRLKKAAKFSSIYSRRPIRSVSSSSTSPPSSEPRQSPASPPKPPLSDSLPKSPPAPSCPVTPELTSELLPVTISDSDPASTQYAQASCAVEYWSDEEDGKGLRENFKELQRQLLPQSKRRDAYDLDYDKGKVPKVKKEGTGAAPIGNAFKSFAEEGKAKPVAPSKAKRSCANNKRSSWNRGGKGGGGRGRRGRGSK